jgi:hypothetical protein
LIRLAVILSFLFALGCGGGSREAVYPVKGQVFYKGKAAAGAVVWFHRVDVEAPAVGQPATQTPPRGVVQEDGSFELSTYAAKDGAPVGRYRVTVRWTKSRGGGDDEENLLPPRYMDPKTSGLPLVEVKAQANELARFDLTP